LSPVVDSVNFSLSKIRTYKLYRQTVRELSELSDRELADLGFARFDIARVAREGAFA
jgi:uncharacterized protein YjiS (DUF1127 family)